MVKYGVNSVLDESKYYYLYSVISNYLIYSMLLSLSFSLPVSFSYFLSPPFFIGSSFFFLHFLSSYTLSEKHEFDGITDLMTKTAASELNNLDPEVKECHVIYVPQVK